MKTPWPKLSETLERHTPGECQNCGAADPLTFWHECDEADRPTPQAVILCRPCADAIIEPHPRLYRETSTVTPLPGAMAICGDCRHRERLSCRSPVAQFNGGPGLEYEPKGNFVHVCRSPRRLSGWIYIASGPVKRCTGKKLKPQGEETADAD